MNTKSIIVGALLAALSLSPAYARHHNSDQAQPAGNTNSAVSAASPSDEGTQKSRHKHRKHSKKRHHKSDTNPAMGAPQQ